MIWRTRYVPNYTRPTPFWMVRRMQTSVKGGLVCDVKLEAKKVPSLVEGVQV